jgi:hypothetical protein
MGWAAALPALVLLAGCAGAQRVALEAQYDVKVVFKKDATTGNVCPFKVDVVGANCEPLSNPPKDCLRVSKGTKVVFQSWSFETGLASTDRFELQFDPFKRKPLDSNGAGRLDVAVDLDKPADKKKEFVYNVLSVPHASCPALDPRIIVE